MKKILNITSIVGVSILLFTGCAQNYDIEPKLDIKSKNLYIAGKKFTSARKTSEGNPVSNDHIGSFRVQIKNYIVKDKNCSNVEYFTLSTKQHNAYLRYSAEDIIKEDIDKYNGKCEVNKLSNVKFYICEKNNNYVYYMSTSSRNGYGYGSVEILSLDRKCYNSMLNYFSEESSSN